MSTKVNYKGYVAVIEFDERDQLFVGRVVNINSIMGFHGETLEEAIKDFQFAVDCDTKD